jgi:hypothetical protein
MEVIETHALRNFGKGVQRTNKKHIDKKRMREEIGRMIRNNTSNNTSNTMLEIQ